ncbi:MAG: RNA recognition motif domain-containing protein [Planctomycetota bacterium]|jgi:RNA recognition motif-containing protein
MNIYVGNLAGEVNEDDLRGIFETFGQVESVNILRDRRSGESKGFGFLRMPSTDEARTAIKDADGTDLKGRAIKVNEAHPRPVAGPRRDNRGRGGPRGGGRDRRGGGERGSRSRY